MLGNIDRDVLLFFGIILFGLCAGVLAGGAVWGIFKSVKSKSPKRIIAVLMYLAVVFIAVASWILNAGIIRLVLTLLIIPIIHLIIVYLTNLFMIPYAEKAKNIKILNLFYNITYIAIHAFLPDVMDKGEMYFFFGLIQGNQLSNIAFLILLMAFVTHLVLFILQIVFAVKIKKNEKQENLKQEENKNEIIN